MIGVMRNPPKAFACCCAAFLSLGITAFGAPMSAATDPVGFVTLTVPGTGSGSAADSALSFKSLALARPVEYQGNAEEVGPATITDLDSSWTSNQFNGPGNACYLEITGPENAAGIGTTYDILSLNRTTQTLTLAQNLASGVTAGATFRIRKHWTIASVFGASNEGGLTGGDGSSADTIRIHRGGGVYDTYIYSLVASGWRKLDANGAILAPDEANAIVYPDDGLLINRRQALAANVVLMGAVKTGKASYPVLPGLNIVGNPFAAPIKLGDSGLYPGLVGGNASTADQVKIFNGTGYDTYFYSTGGAAGIGWRKTGAGATEQNDVEIPVGTSVLIQRRNGGAFDWVILQHPASL
jgi:uncharacterized protein (TIGR02597 family)